MCEKKPEDDLYKFVLKYKYNLIELKAFLNSLENASDNKKNKKRLYNKRLKELKLRIISTILSISILTGVTFYVPKLINKDIYDNKVITSLIHTSYLTLLIYNLYINGYALVVINKELKLRKSDFIESNEIYLEYVEEIVNILESDTDLRKLFIKKYNSLGIYNRDLMNEFQDYYLDEIKLKKEFKEVNYE